MRACDSGWSRSDSGAAIRNSGESGALGEGGGVDSCGYSQLAEDVRDMDACGFFGHEQPLADLPVGQPGGDEAEHLVLPGGEAELAGRVRPELGGGWFVEAQPGPGVGLFDDGDQALSAQGYGRSVGGAQGVGGFTGAALCSGGPALVGARPSAGPGVADGVPGFRGLSPAAG